MPRRSTAVQHAPPNISKGVFHDLMKTMKMEHTSSKLTLKDILSVGTENLKKDQNKTVDLPLPLAYLRKLMALHRTTQENRIAANDSTADDDVLFKDDDTHDKSLLSVNPLDVLCVLLHCSDSFLQQEIITKMAMCQSAIPFLLPAGDGSHCTLMLWAMRDIVKRWRPQSLAGSKGFNEENVVNMDMPVFSFMRLGRSKLSKSKILNQILNPGQLQNNFFIHEDMEGGNVERKISDGLVEMSWYFPCGKSDVFPEPITVTNLRGGLESHWDQFTFLSRVSSAVFIFIERISEEQFTQLSKLSNNSDTQYYFIVTPGPGKNVSYQTKKMLNRLQPTLNLKASNVIIHAGKTNEAMLVNTLKSTILLNYLPNDKIIKKNSIIHLEKETHGLHIDIDENIPECQKAREHAQKITEEINDVAEYKNRTMILQGDLWKKLSKIEKELCRMTKQPGKDLQEYQQELRDKRVSLHEKQNHHKLPPGIKLFINSITHLSQTEKQYFLKWLKLELDSVARSHLSELQAQYKDKCNHKENNKEALRQIDQKLSDSSLGIEHFIREMGQFYEAECSMVKEKKITNKQQQFIKLPGIAADLLLNGFPLELIDGDASNIPLRWITDVLSELDNKTGNKCRMRVITVLGVQSTGKSTLLNTMFGLQFPVASGRCTRGAFMTLLKVRDDFHTDLGCQFIMVIDTEGLKAPELASLEGSYEHDNELATLVVGLSDITIVNMAMENTTEMKDILQIVVHAFLRMSALGKKPNCQFVHQNVSDVSAHENNMRDRRKLLEQLNEMTRIAADMERKSGITTFSDVMDYDLQKDNCYIPGLWLGVPPMASVNSGYSEHVHELKKHLLNLLTEKNSQYRPSTIPDFIKWIESLWNAVKCENFIFSFRNSLVAEAYNKLAIQYSQWEWDFRKAVHEWMIRAETNIKNQSVDCLNEQLISQFTTDLSKVLLNKKTEMIKFLENYFESKNENVHLIERYKQDFTLNIESLNNELERNALRKCQETVSIQKGKFKIQDIKDQSQRIIEDKITDLLTINRNKKMKLDDEGLKKEFEAMWEETLRELQLEKIPTRDVSGSILQLLIIDMSKRGSAVNEDLQRLHYLEEGLQSDFKINDKYIERGWIKIIPKCLYNNKEPYEKLHDFTISLIWKCDNYVTEKVKTGGNYDDTFCQELLHMINSELNPQEKGKSLHFTPIFELDLKRHILGKASREFQEMHHKFIEENDPKLSLEKLKPTYLTTFISTFQNKDLCQTKAKDFCERCLKPAMTDYVLKHLGDEMLYDIRFNHGNQTFNSRTYFQFVLLMELLQKKNFSDYVEYIRHYEKYTKAWILNCLHNKYANSESLKPYEENILSSINTRVRAVLADETCLQSPSVSEFLGSVCQMLHEELVIPQNEMKAVTFQNKASVTEFSSYILLVLPDTITQILSDLQSMNITSLLDKLAVKPQDELFKKLVGCGKQCPFCKVPCEAEGKEHEEHFATIHRPEGLGRYTWDTDDTLVADICSTSVSTPGVRFRNSDTGGEWHPYNDYRKFYPNWDIRPDPSIEASDYWKFIFVTYNGQFAAEYNAKPAKLPDGWRKIAEENVNENLNKVYNAKPMWLVLKWLGTKLR